MTLCMMLGGTVSVMGQEAATAPLQSTKAGVAVDSGRVANTGDEPAVVFSTTVAVPDAPWLRLTFKKVALSGSESDGTGSYLQLTSMEDGALQYLSEKHLQQWRYTSAYFNGDAVKIELIAYPGTGVNHLVMDQVIAGVRGGTPQSICGPTDDRELSDDPRVARALPVGCTAWLIDDCNHCFLAAGHCFALGDIDVVEFNVPLSDPDGTLNHPPPEDQYASDASSIQYTYTGVGDDWGYFGCFENSTTGLYAYEAQGAYFVTTTPPPVSGDIRITGCGSVSSPIPLTWYQVQKTHVGPYYDFFGTTLQYQTDTTGGNSGSPVIFEATDEAIGIHTHGGCSDTSGNSGTAFSHPGLQAALADPQGVCMPFPLDFSYPNGLPSMISPAGGETVRVEVAANGEYVPQPGTGQFHYDAGAGLVTVDMQQITDNVYDAVFPATDCLTTVDYYFSAETTTGERHYDPVSIGEPPSSTYTVVSGYGTLLVLDDPLDANPGWTTQGQWAWGQPTGGGGQYGGPDPTSGYTGNNVYGYNLNGDYPNNMSETHLTSTAIDCSDLGGVRLSFWRWLGVEQPVYDHAYVRVSNNGSSWTTIWENTVEITDSQWVYQEFDISSVADGQGTVYLRWTMGSTDSGWQYCGWNIDDIRVFAIDCDGSQLGDMNCDGVIDGFDIDPFVLVVGGELATYYSLYPDCDHMLADINQDGAIDGFDIDPFVDLVGGGP